MAISPEVHIFRHLEREEGKPQEILTPAERYVEQTQVKQMDELRPTFSDFKLTPEVRRDQTILENKKQEWARFYGKERSRRGKIAEALIFYCIEMNDWFGKNCTTVAASEYDDYCRGTDIILEFDRGDKIVRLAVDVTILQNTREKENEVLEGIERGILTQLKYFISEMDETQGKISRLPKIILKMDIPKIQELSRLIASGNKEKLAQSKIKEDLLEEAEKQLTEQIGHAQKYFQREPYRESDIVIKRIQEVLELFKEIQKKELS